MTDVLTTDQQLTPLGNEQFNVPAILRFIDAEAKNAYGGSERTQIDLIARLVRAQQAEIERRYKDLAKANAQHEHFEREWYLRGDEIERLERALTETHDAWTAETTKRLQAVHERDCAVEDVKRLLEAIRLYVRSKKADLGRNALDWWRLQEIEKESAADVSPNLPTTGE